MRYSGGVEVRKAFSARNRRLSSVKARPFADLNFTFSAGAIRNHDTRSGT